MERRMEVVWFTEMGCEGKTPRTYKNMRTEFAWFAAQNATHLNISRLETLKDQSIDIGVIIIPKEVEHFISLDIAGHLKRVCKKYAFMQEGPSWFFQSLPLQQSLWFFNIMAQADFVLAHNDRDKEYYKGLLGKPTYINPTLMIEDLLEIPEEERQGVIIGGNLVDWYGGFNSLIVAQELQEPIYAPQMGRMDKLETQMQEINHLPYLEWNQWMKTLNKFKYAVHLNPNTIGGTFYLNCAYLGIPCIGNKNTNTQRVCFPELSIEPDDLIGAKNLILKLQKDQEFYDYVSREAKHNYSKNFTEAQYKIKWENILKIVCKNS